MAASTFIRLRLLLSFCPSFHPFFWVPELFFIILCPFSNMTSALLVPLALLRPKPLAMRFLSEPRLISWMYFTSVRSFMLVQKSSMFSLYIYFTPLFWHVRNVFVHLLPSFNKEGKCILLLTKFKNKTQTYSYMVLIWFVKYVLEEIRLLPGLIHCLHFFLIHKMWRSCTANKLQYTEEVRVDERVYQGQDFDSVDQDLSPASQVILGLGYWNTCLELGKDGV